MRAGRYPHFQDFVDAGVHVLTMDLRGFGESGGDGIREAGEFPPFLQTAAGDVDMAFGYLKASTPPEWAQGAPVAARC